MFVHQIDCLNTPLDEFDQAWRDHWDRLLTQWQTQIDALLDTRVTAILENDQTAFLRTLDGSLPNLRQVQLIWFQELSAFEFESLSMAGEPVAQFEDGSLLAERLP